MDYQEIKVYFDGSHYIGISKTTQVGKRINQQDLLKQNRKLKKY